MHAARIAAYLAVAALAACDGDRAIAPARDADVAARDAFTDGAARSADAARDAPALPVPIPWPVVAIPAVREPADNPGTSAKVELGRLLFHDPVLSSDQRVACVTCHSQYWGMSDGLRFAIGVGGTGAIGLGRTGPTHTRRNAPTLWNAAFRSMLFWDGRVDSLEAQVAVPMNDSRELDRAPAAAAAAVAAIPAYVTLFREAFPGESAPVTERTVRYALAAFVRTIVTRRAPYDRYAAGDALALGDDELRGMQLFASVGCADCHAPPLFQSDQFHDVGISSATAEDQGRYEVTGLAEDRRRFRVPTLRNLRESGPYFHDGSAATIEEAVTAMAQRTRPERPLAASEVADLTAFLHYSLMDRTHEPPRAEAVPSGLAVPADGFRIMR